MSGYQYSDSSDEDVCFGEYTIEEAKKDLQRKYVPKKINRRHTHTLAYKLTDEPTSGDILAKDFEQNIKISSASNINCNSEYETANESASTDRLSQNSEFLEKLTKVIDEPVSEASSYNTAFNKTNVDNVDIQCEDTFLARFKNQTLVLDNVHQTLVENTVLSTEYSLNETDNYDYQNDDSSNEIISNGSIINISDDSLDSYSQLLQKSPEVSQLEANENLNVSKDPIPSNNRIIPKKLLYEPTDEFVSYSSSTSQGIDHTNSLYENTAEVQSKKLDLLYDEDNVNKSSFAYESVYVSDSDTEPKDYSCVINLNYSNEYFSDGQDSPENTSFNLNLPRLEPLQRHERVIVDYKQLSKISEKTEFTTCTGDISSMDQHERKCNNSSSDNVSSSEKSIDLEIPEISKRSTTLDVQGVDSGSSLELSKISEPYKQSQVSIICSEASSLSPAQTQEEAFDDTLEEINRLLEHGVDYQMPESMSPLREPFGFDKVISGSFMNNSSNSCGLENKSPGTRTLSSKSLEKCKKFYSAEKISKPSVEGKWSTKVKSGFQQKSTPLSASATNLFTKHTEKVGVNSAFKVPTKPVKKFATPSKLPKATFKSAISPISVYIKHSPKYCPMMRVPQYSVNSHKSSSRLPMPDSSLKENVVCASNQEIPAVIYRPAKHRDIKNEKGITLPASIRKLIKEQVVTKHEHRIQGDECNQSIERRLMESDLTMDLNHSSQDMSIITNKQPFSIEKF